MPVATLGVSISADKIIRACNGPQLCINLDMCTVLQRQIEALYRMHWSILMFEFSYVYSIRCY